MPSFVNTTSPTPFGFFDTDTDFQTEADGVVTFVKRRLGDDILSVELTRKQIWAGLEEATLEYSRLMNEYQVKSQLNNWLGQSTGSISGSEQLYPRENLEYLIRFAEPYAVEAGIGGSYNSFSGSITLQSGRQDYDLYSELTSSNGVALFDHPENSPQSKMRIREVFHFSPSAAYRFFDTSSAVNYMNNEFSFESFTPETIFYVLPVFEDILRAGQLDLSQRVRRSNYKYQIMGRKIRIFPTPSSQTRTKLWVRVQFAANPMSSSIPDESIYGVSNMSNVPFGNLQFGKINSIARQWIRQYTLAISKELLGNIRSKFSSVPIPGNELTLNGDSLITQGREDMKDLRTELREMLDSLTYDRLVEVEADRAEAILRQLRLVPMPNGMAIFTG
ncbi:hypothetical protein HN588_06805 [Candidatus Bathyarchaeota archaeon]|jgi:hypothetical protein|nr:hypothetical protein [Candidatus Bathyarchaeota archaeon]